MPQMILYLNEKHNEIVEKLQRKHKIKSKHKVIELMIDSFENKIE